MTTRQERSSRRCGGSIADWALVVALAALAASAPGRAAAGAADVDSKPRDPAGREATAPGDAATPRAEATPSGAEPGGSASATRATPGRGATTIVYVPPSRGQARHTAGAGTRGISPNAGRAGEARPRVAIVAPRDHVGLTTSAAPTLYWHLSAPTTTRIELTVVDDEAIEPVVQVALPGPVAAGLHAIELSKLGVELAPAKTYRWFVALVHDAHRRSKDELAEGAIERVTPDPVGAPSRSSPSALSGPETVSALHDAARRAAREGYWYDAFADLSVAIERDPSDGGLVAERRALLEQARVGIALP
jgi:hypothetical protein